MSNKTTTAEQLEQASAAARNDAKSKVAIPQPSDLRVLALALESYATWLERDPSTYDADGLAQTLQKVGVIDPDEWRPAPWVLHAVKAMQG